MRNREKIVLSILIAVALGWILFRSAYYDERKKRILSNVLSLWGKDIADASKFFSVPVWRIAAIISQESQGKEDAIGLAYEIGLMQIMRGAWKEFQDRYAKDFSLGLEYGVGQLGNGRTNIFVGTGYLRILYERYGSWDKAIMSYNSGSNYDDVAGRTYLENVRSFERQYFI